MRNELLAKIQAQYDAHPTSHPIVSLDDYFSDNTDEDSIAPNQVDYGRPDLIDLYAALGEIQKKSEVQAVLIGIDDDWLRTRNNPTVWPPAENIHIYTSAPLAEVDGWISGFMSDGAIEGWPYPMSPAAPEVRSGFKVFSVCWD